MEFLDECVVFVASGDGGRGAVNFRREKHVPRGGPDGGDGGDGGAVVFEATTRRNTLVDYQRRRHHRADGGVPGGKQRMKGARGKDLYCPIPVGTVLYDADTEERLADLDTEGAQWRLEGGRGGLGNVHFKSATNRTPRHAQPGEPGTEIKLRMELKLLADVGLVGFPNAGKSTLITAMSAAKARVADYPFTTLVPQLGVVRLDEGRSFVMADIPGLVEGASEGIGLGHQFLRHVERCALHLHLVSPDAFGETDVVERFEALNGELAAYTEDVGDSAVGAVAGRPQIVVLNKVDLLTDEQREETVARLKKASGAAVVCISALSGEGVRDLCNLVWKALVQLGARQLDLGEAPAPLRTPAPDETQTLGEWSPLDG